FGVMFQLPVVAYFLSRVGLIDHRFLIRHVRYAAIGIAILAALLTPPDLISQMLFMVPLALLYAVSIIVAFFAPQRGGPPETPFCRSENFNLSGRCGKNRPLTFRLHGLGLVVYAGG